MRSRPQQLSLSLLLSLAGLASCRALDSRERDGAVTAHFGRLELRDDDAWNGTERQDFLGATVNWPVAAGPWQYEAGLAYYDAGSSLGGGTDFDTRTTELSLGLRRPFAPWWGSVHTYVAGGLVGFYTEQERQPPLATARESEDWNGGLFLSGGLWGLFGDDLRLGAELRVISEEALDPGGLDLDQGRLSVTLGYGF